jgi:hypothetical protein
VGRWRLLPQTEWADEFNPLYTDDKGQFCEGDPSGPEGGEDVEIIRYLSIAPETGDTCMVEAVQNEALVSFAPSVRAPQIRSLFAGLGLGILQAWFDPKPHDPDASMSWFLVEILPGSRYRDQVGRLVEHLRSRCDVTNAGYSVVGRLCGTALYTNPATQPNDKNLQRALNSGRGAVVGLRLSSAWYDAGADLGGPKVPSCVVVMDTGIDVDHEDFGGPGDPGQVFAIGQKRRGLAAGRANRKFGEVRDFEAVPPNQPFDSQTGTYGDPVPASGAPINDGRDGTADTYDPLKFLDLNFRGHGHGTVMAGVIAARSNNGRDVVGGGIDAVKVMSARLPMVGDHRVRVASAAALVRRLTTDFGRSVSGAVQVVYFGFAVGDVVRSAAMDQLLQAMIADRKAGNDRLWVAPALNDSDSTLSYPAAILKQDRDKTTTKPAGFLPAVLGVTGCSGPEFLAGSSTTNHGSRKDAKGNFLPLDRAIYGVSAYQFWSDTLDARDQWYGVYRSLKPKKKAPDGAVGYYGINRDVKVGGGSGPDDLRTSFILGRLYSAENPDFVLDVRFDRFGRRIETRIPDPPPQTLVGNSLAAAQIAALAGMILAKGSGAPAAQVAELIRRKTRGNRTDRAAPTQEGGTADYQVIEYSFNSGGRNSKLVTRRIPGFIDFLAALVDDPKKIAN